MTGAKIHTYLWTERERNYWSAVDVNRLLPLFGAKKEKKRGREREGQKERKYTTLNTKRKIRVQIKVKNTKEISRKAKTIVHKQQKKKESVNKQIQR